MSITKTIRSGGCSATVFIENTNDHLQKVWQKGKFYEEETLAYIKDQHGKSGGIFVDCGSCIGNHTLYFLKACQPKFVISIEPVEENIRFQEEILKLNRLHGKVRLLNVALSDKCSIGSMNKESGNPWNVGMWILKEDVKGGNVIVATLDSLLKPYGLGNITLVKFDVQWMEDKVINGARELLTKYNPALIVELASQEMYKKVVPQLGKLGYKIASRVLNQYNWEFRK